MIGVVLVGQKDLAASLVAVESWRAATGCDAVVLVDHPDLVGPLVRAGGAHDVLSWAQLGTPAGAGGAAVQAILDRCAPGEVVVVLPATAYVLDLPEDLLEASKNGPAVASRGKRALASDDRLRPSADEIEALDAIHPQLSAFRAGDPRARSSLDGADARGAAGRPASSHVHGSAVVESPGLGLAWWNVESRPLTWDGDRLHADGVPVTVADLDGWSPRHEHMIHPDMTRLLSSGDPALRRLVDAYAVRYAIAAEKLGERPEPWPADAALADLIGRRPAADREAILRDDPGAREAFLGWAEGSDVEDTVWSVNRYLIALRRTRYDLQAAFPDINDRADVRAYLAWARSDGAADGIPARFLGPVATVDGPEPLPEEAARAADAPDGLGGVNVIGVFREPALGIAEIARQVAAGLEAGGMSVHRVTVDRRGRPDPADGDAPLPYRVTISCLNADLLPVVRRRLRRRIRDDSHQIGVWWWELASVPASWDPAFALVHEIWAGTGFVAEAFAGRFQGPVRTVPMGLGALAEPGVLPAAVAADERPYALVAFDYASRIERKNPVGAIEAFLRSGAAPSTRLVVKSVNGSLWPREAERVRLAAGRAADGDVLLLDERLDASEQAALVAGACVHVALHRAEGLGLTIVEAMMRGVPVIATDYGGSTELLVAETGWPIPWTLGAVPPECDPYPAGATWAEPDIDVAAAALREVVAGGPDVTARARAGRVAASGRAARVASGMDVVAAARDAIETLRVDQEERAREATRRRNIRARLRRLRG